MTRLLESYAAGRWYRADDEGTPVHDAATGEEVARVSSTGLDLGAMVAHGRAVGGPALRALTFHERAGLLKQLAKHLLGAKDELYEASYATGATARDSAVDIDGGIGTVFSIASKGTRELPNDTVLLDGALEQLGKGGTFVGQHVYTSRPGVAVQINAFNFPVWGMLEKLAPAFLAGHAVDREAGRPDRLPHRAGGAPDHRVGDPPRGLAPAARRQPGRPRRRARRAGPRRLHRLRPHRRACSAPTRRSSTAASPQRRGRLAQLLGARPRRRRRRPRVRPVRQGRRPRDDGQGGPEVHRHPPRPGAPRRRPTTSSRPSRRGSRRSPSATPATRRCAWARS